MPSPKKYYAYILCGLFILCAAAVAGTKWYSRYEQTLKQERNAAISEAIQIYENGDYGKAKKTFKKYAKRGDSEAMLYLGNICGNHTKEYAEALKWYQKAAVNGYAADAYAAIGTMYREGMADSTLSKEDRLEKGIEFYEKAADAGNVKAMIILGDLYFSVGDHDKAESLYMKAADHGDWIAMCRIAYIYANKRQEHTKNLLGDKTRIWLEKAAQSSQNPTLKALVADEYMFQPANFAKATEWAESAIDNGSKYGHLILAQICSDKEAGKYYDQAKALTNINIFIQEMRQASKEFAEISKTTTPIQMTLPQIEQTTYEQSIHKIALVFYDLEQYKTAMEWLKKAETVQQQEDSAYASLLIGQMYHDGEGVKKDNTKAMQYYKKAAAKGSTYAMIRIGYMYVEKEVSQRRDFAKAMEWYKKAAALGSSYAMYCVGVLYHTGHKSYGVEQNLEAARKWYNDAVALDNNEMARNALNSLPAADYEQQQRIINGVKTTRYLDGGKSWNEFTVYYLERVEWQYIGMYQRFDKPGFKGFIHKVTLDGYFPNTAGGVSKLKIDFGVIWDNQENKFTIAQIFCYINGQSQRRMPLWIDYALGS